jgi:hypothetical protein
MNLPLAGFDMAVELGRSGINKILKAIEKSPIWTFRYQGQYSGDPKKDIILHIVYDLALADPRVRPIREQRETPTAGLKVLLDVVGTVTSAGLAWGEPFFALDTKIHGELSVDVTAELRGPDLVISFADSQVDELLITDVPSEIRYILKRGLEVVLQERLASSGTSLPLSRFQHLSGALQGKLDSVRLKTHFYTERAGDSALGIGLCFNPGSNLPKDRDLTNLFRVSPSYDVVVSASLRYLNTIIANALDESRGILPRYNQNGRPDPDGSLRIRSTLVAAQHDHLSVIVRIGSRNTILTISGDVFLTVANDNLKIEVRNVDPQLTAMTEIFFRVVLNVLYLLCEGLVARNLEIRADELSKRLEDMSQQLSFKFVFSKPIGGSISVNGAVRAILYAQDVIGIAFDIQPILR